MRKINNGRFRQNGGNSIYSLNYKFDSISSAGKFNGTALELIKKYNELAKEAHSNGDYVEMEVFRQYAEHYRKIVTEINERKNQNKEINVTENAAESINEETSAASSNTAMPSETPDLEPQTNTTSSETETTVPAQPTIRRRRNFTIVEVSDKQETTADLPIPHEISATKPRRRLLKRRVENNAEENNNATQEA